MPRNSAKSAYFHYMVAFKNAEEKRTGRKFSNLGEVADAASENWLRMDKNERLKYEERAKSYKSSGPSQKDEGKNIQQNQCDMHQTVDSFVKCLSFPRGLAQQEIHFMMVNYFCEYNGLCYPAEIAIAKFSFNVGLIKKYHLFLAPEKLPLGYAATAKLHADKTHQLPIPPYAKGEQNFSRVFDRLMEILQTGPSCEYKGRPIVFVNDAEDDLNPKIVQSVLKCLSPMHHDNIVVYPMTQLLLALKQQAAKHGKPNGVENIHLAKIMLDKNSFSLTSGKAACQYHFEIDATSFCPLASVSSWCFLMADYICPDLGIKLIPGKHLPKNADVNTVCESLDKIHIHNPRSAMTAWLNTTNTKVPPSANYNSMMSNVEGCTSVTSTAQKSNLVNDNAVCASVVSQLDTEKFELPNSSVISRSANRNKTCLPPVKLQAFDDALPSDWDSEADESSEIGYFETKSYRSESVILEKYGIGIPTKWSLRATQCLANDAFKDLIGSEAMSSVSAKK